MLIIKCGFKEGGQIKNEIVMCHPSPVTCHFFFKFYPLKEIGQSGGASLWRLSYQRGLPRLTNPL